ncbi:unnamed protein product [Bursaphelenchus xylophilus]|uniref:(pine wood nematode) hypothetical protein n=1 Tax=Bursaphelenchus xylophilus TaxID=6326 RepID=A0A1I7RYJ7_BURXY|nr:unnamed protein product [Bursaphelenchus xylophilus]CAG9092609.1 unnamed protein product [Bursaphelenchus xylophilus]
MVVFTIYDLLYSTARGLKRRIWKPDYKAVIFDMGGVYYKYPVPKRADDVLKSEKDVFLSALKQYELGDIAFPKLFEAAVQKFDFLKGMEPREWLKRILGEKDPFITKAVQKLKESGQFKVALLTNIGFSDDSRSKTDVPEDIDQFDAIIESCRYRLRKPDEEIYKVAAKELDLKPEECIFVDDLWINCRVADLVGMTSVEVVVGDTKTAVRKIENLLGVPLLE